MALVAVAVRELSWVVPNVAREVAGWRRRALQIPDRDLREQALLTLRRERLNTEGAALFATLPRQRHGPLLRLLVAFQILLDYLDTVGEQPHPDPLANGRQLHLALTEALDPGGPVSDYYREHLGSGDGGFLRALVETCREGCRALPAFERVRSELHDAALLGTVQVPNHDPDPERREAGQRAWVLRELPGDWGAQWFELAAAASSSLWTLALLALATDPRLDRGEAADAQAAYFPWVCAASTLLDAFVDQAVDRAEGSHSWMQYYAGGEAAAERLCEIVHRSAVAARGLRDGERHALIVSGMVSMYLSKASARTCELAPATRELLRAAGSLTRVQVPVMRIVRRAWGLRDA